jgi:hypothetical protein
MKWSLTFASVMATAAGWLVSAWMAPVEQRASAANEARDIADHERAGAEGVPGFLAQYPGGEQGSAKLAAWAARWREVPLSQASELRMAVDSWPPGTARELARTTWDSRERNEERDSDPSAHEAPDVGIEKLAEALGENEHFEAWALERWASYDPIAATEAVLKMSKGEERTNAVDVVANARAGYDPAGAMEFILQSGEGHLDTGAVEAWMALMSKNKAAGPEVLKRMSSEQQESFAASVALWLTNDVLLGRMDDESFSTLGAAAMELVDCPAKQSLMLDLFRRGVDLVSIRPYLPGGGDFEGFVPEKNPVQAAFAAADLERQVMEEPERAVAALAEVPFVTPEGKAAVINAAAPVILPQLCRTGHIAEAVQLLDGIRDQEVWRTGFNAVLPYWMDNDPAAARAAFEKAPLTALEKERWMRKPAFLLNP